MATDTYFRNCQILVFCMSIFVIVFGLSLAGHSYPQKTIASTGELASSDHRKGSQIESKNKKTNSLHSEQTIRGNRNPNLVQKLKHLRKKIEKLEAKIFELEKLVGTSRYNSVQSAGTDQSQLIAYWPLDEKGGTTSYDLSGNGYHLINHGARVDVEAIRSSGYRFDGVDDHLQSENVDLIDSSSWSVSFWVKALRGNDSANEGFISQGRSQNYIGLGNWTRSFVFNGESSPKGARLDLFEDDVIRDGEFHHIAVVFNRGKLEIYVDGTRKINKTVHTDHYNWSTDDFRFSVASKGGQGNYFKGIMDEIRLYSSAISRLKIKELSTFTH